VEFNSWGAGFRSRKKSDGAYLAFRTLLGAFISQFSTKSLKLA
jgi:hypothetical protein